MASSDGFDPKSNRSAQEPPADDFTNESTANAIEVELASRQRREERIPEAFEASKLRKAWVFAC